MAFYVTPSTKKYLEGKLSFKKITKSALKEDMEALERFFTEREKKRTKKKIKTGEINHDRDDNCLVSDTDN